MDKTGIGEMTESLEQRAAEVTEKKYENYAMQSMLGSGVKTFRMPWKDFVEIELIIADQATRIKELESEVKKLKLDIGTWKENCQEGNAIIRKMSEDSGNCKTGVL